MHADTPSSGVSAIAQSEYVLQILRLCAGNRRADINLEAYFSPQRLHCSTSRACDVLISRRYHTCYSHGVSVCHSRNVSYSQLRSAQILYSHSTVIGTTIQYDKYHIVASFNVLPRRTTQDVSGLLRTVSERISLQTDK